MSTQASSMASNATAVTSSCHQAGRTRRETAFAARAQAQSAEKPREMERQRGPGSQIPGININRTQIRERSMNKAITKPAGRQPGVGETSRQKRPPARARVAEIDYANHPAAELPVGRQKHTVEVRSRTEESQRQEQQIKHIARCVNSGLGDDRIGNRRTVSTTRPRQTTADTATRQEGRHVVRPPVSPGAPRRPRD